MNSAQMLSIEYIMLIAMIYICIRSTFARKTFSVRYFARYSYALTIGLVFNVPVRALELNLIKIESRPIVYILYAVSLFVIGVMTYEWFIFSEAMHKSKIAIEKKNRYLLLIPLVVFTVLILVSIKTHWLFYIDENAVYHRGSLFFLQMLIPYLYVAVTVISNIVHLIETKNIRLFIRVLIAITPAFCGSVLQIFFGGSYTFAGFTLGAVVIYIDLYMEEANRIEKLDAVQKVNDELVEVNKTLEEQMIIIGSMGKVYYSVYYIDFQDNSFFEVTSKKTLRDVVGNKGNTRETFELMCQKLISPEHADAMREFVNLDTLNDRLRDREVISMQYIGLVSGWSQAFFIVADRLENGNVNHLLFAVRQIHEEKAKEEEHNRNLADALVAADRANRAKTVFLNNMSHDIRTPMNAIVGFTALAVENAEDPVLTKNYLSKIDIASQHLLSLINDVLDMSRIESGKVVIDKNDVFLPGILHDIKTIVQPDLNSKNLTMDVDVRDIENEFVMADKLRLNQIMLNIVSNAIKFTPVGGKIDISVVESPCDIFGYASFEFRIKDNGIGISKEFQSHIFEAFTREKSSTVSGIPGTGLGLSITKNIVELMGGKIAVLSEEGKGTEFIIALTFEKSENPERTVKDVEASLAGVKTVTKEIAGKRILITEDNLLNQEIAKTILEGEGFVVEVADDGSVAIEMIEDAPSGYYDLILMDIQMPIMDGYETTRRIRSMEDETKSSIPIIAMTANAFEEDRNMAIEAGMNEHMAKPIDVKLFKEMVEKYI